MKTPCQEAPEAWVGKSDALRNQAAIECRTRCPVLAECKAGKFGLPGPEDIGVWFGVDLGYKTRTRRESQPAVHVTGDVKECEQCGGTITRKRHTKKEWAQQRFCSQRCRGDAQAIKGLPVVKRCELCAGEYTRGSRGPGNWLASRFCGVACAARARRGKKRAA